MTEYNYDQQTVELLKTAFHFLEEEMNTFENRKAMMGEQRMMNVNTHDVVNAICSIVDNVSNCVLNTDRDIAGARIAYVFYLDSIERMISLKDRTPGWTFDTTGLQSKITPIKEEIRKIDSLYGGPNFDL